MKAMALTAQREMQLQEKTAPTIQSDTDVLVKIEATGVCGSDIHYYLNGKIGSQVVEYPFVLGHECAGTVEEVGSAVTRVKQGDLVAVDPSRPCHNCDQCEVEREHTCRNVLFLGTPGQGDGCLRDHIVMPEECLFPTKGNISAEEAAVCEPLSIGAYAVKLSIPMEGAKIAILGSGPIGLSVLLVAKAQGAAKIYITDKIDGRLDVASRAGALMIGNPDKEDIVEKIKADEPLGVDAVFECCGEQDAMDNAVDLLKPGGKLVLVGIPEVDRVSFTIDKLRRKELTLQNIRRQVGCVQDALDLIENGKIDVNFMITHRFGFDQTKEAFELVAGYEDGVIKAMITV